jgi:hypothetical protein
MCCPIASSENFVRWPGLIGQHSPLLLGVTESPYISVTYAYRGRQFDLFSDYIGRVNLFESRPMIPSRPMSCLKKRPVKSQPETNPVDVEA